MYRDYITTAIFLIFMTVTTREAFLTVGLAGVVTVADEVIIVLAADIVEGFLAAILAFASAMAALAASAFTFACACFSSGVIIDPVVVIMLVVLVAVDPVSFRAMVSLISRRLATSASAARFRSSIFGQLWSGG